MRRPAILLLAVLVVAAGCSESNLVRSAATDTTPPQVVATVPASGARNVSEARVVVTFSEPMNVSSVTLEATPSVTWGTPTWSDGDRTVTFVPADLRPGTRYTVRIAGRDRAGNALAGNTAFEFSTGSLVQVGAVAQGVLQNRIFAAPEERVYAVFLAWVVGQPERALQALPDEHRHLREVVGNRAPEATRKAREFFSTRSPTSEELAQYALWLDPDLRLGTAPTPVAVQKPGTGPSPAPAPRTSPPGQSRNTPSPSPPPGESLQPSSGSRGPEPGKVAASPAPSQAASPSPEVQASPPARTTPSGSSQPADVRARLEGLDAVVRELYTAARAQELWAGARPEHEQEAQRYRPAVEERLRQAVTFLRLSGLPFQRLVVVPNLLGPRHAADEVWVGQVLHVVVGPSAGPNARAVVRIFLRAVISPVVEAAQEQVDRLVALHELVRAEAESRGIRDWKGVVVESLVRAIEARLLLPAQDEQDQFLDSSFGEGFLLARHFANRLDSVQRGEQDLQEFVRQSLGAANAEQLRQQWAGRSRR